LKKLAVIQIIIGTLILLLGVLAASGLLSSFKFVYFNPLRGGPPVQALRPEYLGLACAAISIVVLSGLVAAVKNAISPATAGGRKSAIIGLSIGILPLLTGAAALGFVYLAPVVAGVNEPEALKVARLTMQAILPAVIIYLIVSALKLRKNPGRVAA